MVPKSVSIVISRPSPVVTVVVARRAPRATTLSRVPSLPCQPIVASSPSCPICAGAPPASISRSRSWIPAYRAAAREIADLDGGVDPQTLLAAVGYDAATGGCDPHSVFAASTNLELATAWAAICGLDIGLVLSAAERTLDESARRDAIPLVDLDTFFAGLAARGFVLGVATMDGEATARAMLDRFGVLGHLAFLCGGDSGAGAVPSRGRGWSMRSWPSPGCAPGRSCPFRGHAQEVGGGCVEIMRRGGEAHLMGKELVSGVLPSCGFLVHGDVFSVWRRIPDGRDIHP